MLLACVDVDYRGDRAAAACLLFGAWTDADSCEEVVECVAGVAPYQPGQFYLRELPCLLAVLGRVAQPLETVIVDGYVWLDGEGTPGLGARLYEALGGTVPVVGVAKTVFPGAVSAAAPVTRGASRNPLYVTAVGLDLPTVAQCVAGMAGRIGFLPCSRR